MQERLNRDLVWRKVLEPKDSSQGVAVVSLKALHLQYNQAVAKVSTTEIAKQRNWQRQEPKKRTSHRARVNNYEKEPIDRPSESWLGFDALDAAP